MKKALLWFRQDLRIADNPAWHRAMEEGMSVIPVFIWSPGEEGDSVPGSASRWWLHHALGDLEKQLSSTGHKLILREGRMLESLERVVQETGAGAVYWNRCLEPGQLRRDSQIRNRMEKQGISTWTGNSGLLREPWTILSKSGRPYRVFTPYYKTCRETRDPDPVQIREHPAVPDVWPESLPLEDLGLEPRHGWTHRLAERWRPTRDGAMAALQEFVDQSLEQYPVERDYPGEEGVSRLSAYLHWGQVGIREVVKAIRGAGPKGREVYHKELYWREFAHHVLYHFPDTVTEPLQPRFRDFPWKSNRKYFAAWTKGKTGYPMVDAAMRELWQTGWMHNRSRMIVASFLVKHLLQPWQDGAGWFWDTLVDADLANNTLGWQWAAGCGADAAPYFRIFNPTTQGKKFDPEGKYIRKYVPELRGVPGKYIHQPWTMPSAVQEACNCRIGKEYPMPIVDHGEAREAALQAFSTIRDSSE